MTFSIDVVQDWVDMAEAWDKQMALFAADPHGVGSPAAVEVVGGTYARQDSVWVRSGPTLLTLTEPVIWRGLPPGAVVAAVGGFDDPFAGRFLFADLLGEPQDFPSGGTYVLPAGEYALGIDL